MFKSFIRKCLLAFTSLFVVACLNSPAFPERDGRQYLEKKKYDAQTVDTVVNLGKLDRATFEKLSKESDINVRYLLGTNANLPSDLLDKLTKDSSDFVRGGAASNPNLTKAQIEALKNDSSVTTQGYLASNPAVPEKDLIELHEKHDVGLLYFAMNPKCPEVLKKKIVKENDELTMYWLKETQKEN